MELNLESSKQLLLKFIQEIVILSFLSTKVHVTMISNSNGMLFARLEESSGTKNDHTIFNDQQFFTL